MTGPRINPLDQALSNPLDDLLKQQEAPASTGEPSVFKRFLTGMKNATANPYPEGSKAADAGLVNDRKRVTFDRPTLPENASTWDKVKSTRAEDLGEMASNMVAQAPAYAILGAGIGALGTKASAYVSNPILKAALSATPELAAGASKAKVIGATMLAGIPQEVATNLIGSALADPTSINNSQGLKANIALGAASTIFRGLGANKAYLERISKATTIPELKTIKMELDEAIAKDPIILPPSPLELPNQLRAANARAAAMEEASAQHVKELKLKMQEKLNASLQKRFDALADGKLAPEKVDSDLDKAALEGIKNHLEAAIVAPAEAAGKGARPRSISYIEGNPGNSQLLTADELQSFYSQLKSFKPYKQARLTKVQARLDKAAKNGFRYADPREIFDIQQDMMGFAHELSKGFDKPNNIIDVLDVNSTRKAAKLVEDNGLISTSTKMPKNFVLEGQPGNPLGLITSGKKSATIQGNPVISSMQLPGSGVQSVYPHVPASIPTSVISKVQTNKFTGIPPQALTPDQQHIASKLDFMNKETQAAREAKGNLLGHVDQAVYAIQDFQKPVEVASPRAFDLAGKMLRVNRRADLGVRTNIMIPQADGTYVQGPESFEPMYRALGNGDGEKAHHFNIYALARQELVGEGKSTTIDPVIAARNVDWYDANMPELKDVFENRYLPITKAMVDIMKNSPLPISDISINGMYDKQAHVSLSRAAFGPTDIGGALRQRSDKASGRLIGDLASNSIDNLRSLIKISERAKVLHELVESRDNNPGLLLDHVEFILDHGKNTVDIESIMKRMDPNLPEITKRAYAEAMQDPLPGSQEFRIKYKGQIGTVRLSKDLANSLDATMARGSALIAQTPEGANMPTKAAFAIGKGIQTTEKSAGMLYSYYRDIFGGGPFYDYIEAKMNLGEGLDLIRRPWTIVSEPYKGLRANMKQSDEVKMITAAGGGTGHRGRLAADDLTAKTKNILELASKPANSYRVVHGTNAVVGFADDLANATRTAISLQKLKQGFSYPEVATIHNSIIGDPYKSGALLAGLSRFTNFLNFPIQANAATLKSMAGKQFQDPLQAAGKSAAGNINISGKGVAGKIALNAARAITTLSMPAAALWYIFKDDKEIQDLYQDPGGRNHLFVRNPLTEEVTAIRMPYLYGAIYQKPVIEMLQRLNGQGDTKSVEEIGKAALQELVPNFMPFTANAVLPMYTGQRLDPFQGAQSVIPGNRKGMLPEDQGDPATVSEFAKQMSKTGMPAGVAENVLKTFLIGPMYTKYQVADDYLFGEKNHKPKTFDGFSFIPGAKHVDVNKAGIRYVNEFYDTIGKTQQILKSMQSAQDHGQIERYLELQATYGKDIPKLEQIVTFKEDMDQITSDINDIKLNEMWSPEQKRKEIDRQVALRILTARRAMEIYGSINKKP